MLRFRLTSSHKDDLATVCALGKDRLDKLADAIDAADFTIQRSRIEKIITDALGNADLGEIITRVLLGIAGTFRRNFASAQDAINGLTQGLQSAHDNDARFKNWEDCVPALSRLLGTRSVKLAAKAIDISYDFERVYIAGRLLTSIRPVFDDPREEIIGTTIVQTLRLEFAALDGHHSSLSIAVDINDIQRLKGECDRAIRKAEICRERVQGDSKIEAIIPGEEQNE